MGDNGLGGLLGTVLVLAVAKKIIDDTPPRRRVLPPARLPPRPKSIFRSRR